MRGFRRIEPHDVFAAVRWDFIKLEFDVEAAAVLVRPADGYLRPDAFILFRAAFDDAVKLVGRHVFCGCFRGSDSGSPSCYLCE